MTRTEEETKYIVEQIAELMLHFWENKTDKEKEELLKKIENEKH
jgi:hypothetical protein